MGGIKGMVCGGAILVGTVFFYLRSSISNEEGTSLKAETTVEKATEPSAPPAVGDSEMQNTTMTPKVTDAAPAVTPPVQEAAPKTVAGPAAEPDSATLKKIHDFHAKERHVARQILKRCQAGQEKRPQLCSHARRVMKSAPGPKKSARK